jgi:hypothetical protein
LYRQRPRMLPPDQDGSTRARFESEFELRLPARRRRRGLYLSHPLKEEDRERVEDAHKLRGEGTACFSWQRNRRPPIAEL